MISLRQKQLDVLKRGVDSGVLSPIEASELLDQIEFIHRKTDILSWGKYYFPDKFTLPFCRELHDYLIEISENPFTVTLAPRGHAKTTISCFLIPLFDVFVSF